MSIKSVIENYKEHGFKYFTFDRAKVYLRSLLRKLTGLRLKEKEAIVFSEIITFKALTCPDCVQLGYCRVCKCPINELFVAMDVGCSDGKFPAFQVKRDWKFILYHLKRKEFKEAWKEFKNKKHWINSWEEYKERQGIFLTLLYA